MILPSEHLIAVCALKGGLARVLANVIDWNLIQKTNPGSDIAVHKINGNLGGQTFMILMSRLVDAPDPVNYQLHSVRY